MPDFTLEESIKAQRALRQAAGLPEEMIPADRLIAMMTDEIDALRAQGAAEDDIVAIISDATGKPVSGADLAQHLNPEWWKNY